MRRLENDDLEQGAADGGALLGEFLRARRDGLRPHDVGLPAGVRRRAPGLRYRRLCVVTCSSSLCHHLATSP